MSHKAIPNHKDHLAPAGQGHYIDQATIMSTHPLVMGKPDNKGNHPAYDAALVMVGERHAKGDLADLVGHLLVKIADKKVVTSDERREAVCEAIGGALGEALDCTRQWSAWGVGTMSEGDFVSVAGDPARVAEIADAAIAAFQPTTHEAFAAIKAAVHADQGYAWGWQCNVAMSFYDAAGDIPNRHRIANEGAARFMRLAFDLDVTQFREYLDLAKGWAILGAAVSTGAHLKGHASLAEMVDGHVHFWRGALAHMKTNPGYDAAYVDHELKALADINVACKAELAAEPPANNSASVAAIQFALEADEGMTYLRLWNQGEFESCRREWPEAPDECYIGADQFFVPSSKVQPKYDPATQPGSPEFDGAEAYEAHLAATVGEANA